jgi:enoyl-CoA hydratase/carnithine racemase
MTFENILYEKKGAVAYVTLNRPKVLNALNQRTLSELKAAFEDARRDPTPGAGNFMEPRAWGQSPKS